MQAANKRFRGWWASPPRTGMRLLIAPWEYRHLRAWARVRILTGLAAAALCAVTLSFGGGESKTYVWALAFLAIGIASWAFAYWELSIARSG
jgi:hypothetical protein